MPLPSVKDAARYKLNVVFFIILNPLDIFVLTGRFELPPFTCFLYEVLISNLFPAKASSLQYVKYIVTDKYNTLYIFNIL